MNVNEQFWVWFACCFVAGALIVMPYGKMGNRTSSKLIVFSVFIFAIAIIIRWIRLGHGPFITLFEILLSNVFSLGLITSFVYWRRPELRITMPVLIPILLLMSLWLISIPATDSHLPATYNTPWLWVHLVTGKIFLAMIFIALGMAGVILLKSWRVTNGFFSSLSTSELHARIWLWLILAIIFHSLMLISGAVWAQDAWGRYWDWDPLETSAFLTWLSLALVLHSRISWHLTPVITSMLVIIVFSLAFLTFFGIPFISQAPHQGAI